jgi:hypothetical protein
MNAIDVKHATYNSKPVKQAIQKIHEIITRSASEGLSSCVIERELLPDKCANAIEKYFIECDFSASLCTDGLHIKWIEY